MTDAALDLIEQAIRSPWVYLALFALAAVDSFLPIIPGETALITVAVFSASGGSSLFLTILAGAIGAFAGDHVSYLVGRVSLGRLSGRVRRRSRSRSAYGWARTRLAERGGQVLLASRYVPGVRTATTITMGGVGYPLRRFSLYDTAAALLWATGWSLLGYLGGSTFGKEPLKALAFGLGAAFTLMLLAEAGRRLWRRHAARSQAN